MVLPSDYDYDQPAPEEPTLVVEFYDEESFESQPWPIRWLINIATTIVVIAIGPFMLAYYGTRWICGWRPKKWAKE
jgi:hypothetical protein